MKKAHFHISIIILAMIFGDLLTTYVGLTFFGGEEVNPVINALGNWWIVSAWKISSGVIVTVVAGKMIHTFYPALATFQGIFVCGYLGLIVNNISWW